MEIKLKGRQMPRAASGDVKFERLGGLMAQHEANLDTDYTIPGLLDVFGPTEVVELVNRALYQIEYQTAAHRKYGARKREVAKALKNAVGKQEAKAQGVDRELKGE